MLKRLSRALAPGARKASASGRAVAALYNVGQPTWTPRDYEHLAREGYMSAVWVFACVREIVTALKGVPVYVRRTGGDGPEPVDEGHPLARLIRRPNELQAWPAYVERLAAYMLLSGNSYAETVTNAAGKPMELHSLRPDRVRVVMGRDGLPLRYVYSAGGREVTYQPELIRHLRTFHPVDDLYGFSPLEAAARAVDFHAAGMAHNTALLQNGARPTGALSTDSTLTDVEHDRLRREVDRLVDAADRKGRPLLLEAGLKWVEMGLSPRDIDFHEGNMDAARQIHAAYGVHPVLTGLQEGTYENQAEALKSLYTRVVLPLLAHILTELGAWLAPKFGEEALELYADADAVDALSEDRDAVWGRARRAYLAGLVTLNEARREMGYEALPEGDELRPEPTGDAQAAGDGSERDSEGKELGEPPEARSEPLSARERLLVELKAAKEEQRALADEWEEHFASVMRRHFRRERDALRSALAQADEATLYTAASEAILHDELQEAAEEELLAILGAFGRAELETLTRHSHAPPVTKADRLPSLFGLLFDETLDWARRRAAELVVEVTEETRRRIRRIVTNGVLHGDSVVTIAKAIDTLYLEQIIPRRSLVIARTEVMGAANYGSHQAARATGLRLEKEWLSGNDFRVRTPPRDEFDHVHANGQRRALDDPFEVSGELMQHPGDRSLGASPGNLIQCRCVALYIPLDY